MAFTDHLATKAIVSVSMAIVATQAMASVGDVSTDVVSIDNSPIDADLRAKIDAAVAKRDVRQAVSDAFSVLATSFGEGNMSLSGKYFSNEEVDVAIYHSPLEQSKDFNADPNAIPHCYSNCHSACYSNCHEACHQACHASRSWR